MEVWPEINDSDVQSFDVNGFLALRNALASETLSEVRRVYDSVLLRANTFKPGSECHAISRTPGLVWIHSPEFLGSEIDVSLELGSECRKAASRLLRVAAEEVSVSYRFFFKPAFIGAQVPWHQDEAYKNPQARTQSVNVWIALDPVDEESGCLGFITGSHQGEVRQHVAMPEDPTSGLALVAEGVDETQTVFVRLPAGGATIHHCRTLHFSPPNHSPNGRRSLVLVCEGPPQVDSERDAWPWQSDRVRSLHKD